MGPALSLGFAGCVTSVQALGSRILATEFLGSVSTSLLLSTKHGRLLAPLSADYHPVFTPACAQLDR